MKWCEILLPTFHSDSVCSVEKSFVRKLFTPVSSSFVFAKCSACTFKSESAESVFSDCQQIVKKICFVVFCVEILQQFSPTFAKRLLTSYVFLSHSETLR